MAKSRKGRSRTADAQPAPVDGALVAVRYIESSALVAALLERDADALKSMRSKIKPITSALTFAEAARAIVRARVAERLTPDRRASPLHEFDAPVPGAPLHHVDRVSLTSEVSEPSQKSTKVGDWNLSAYKTTGTVGLRAERGLAGAKTVGAGKTITGADLIVAIDAHLEVAGLRVVADIPVTRGEVGTSHFRVYGIDGLVMSVQAGSVNGLSDNRKARIEIPIQLRQNVIIGGFPATLTQKFRFLVQTAFTAKNGNLTASGEWDVDGSIGMDGQTVTLPTVTARGKKLIDSIMGVSVGVNGIVVAVSFEFGLLFGLPLAGAGPSASFITSLGLTNGSSLGIVQCQQVSITSDVSAGVSIQVFDPIKRR